MDVCGLSKLAESAPSNLTKSIRISYIKNQQSVKVGDANFQNKHGGLAHKTEPSEKPWHIVEANNTCGVTYGIN